MKRIVLSASVLAVALCVARWDLVRVAHDSMADTYCDGDLLLARRAPHTVRAGDVVVVRHPPDGILLKRVVAKGGDVVELKNGLAVINERQLPEPYVGCRERLQQLGRWWEDAGLPQSTPISVPAHALFVLGDNRAISRDSRQFGPIDQAFVIAVIERIVVRPRGARCHC